LFLFVIKIVVFIIQIIVEVVFVEFIEVVFVVIILEFIIIKFVIEIVGWVDVSGVTAGALTSVITLASTASAKGAGPEIVDHVDEVRIKIDHDTERMVRESMRALARMESIYVRQHCLVDVVQARGVDRHGLPRRPWVRKTGKAYLKSRPIP
jgi:hypothetical protein